MNNLKIAKLILSGQFDAQIGSIIKERDLDITVNDHRYKTAAAIEPYYFVKKILNYRKLIMNPHYEMCSEMRFDKDKRIMRLRPRGIFKTTIYVIAKIIDLLIINPNLNILIAMNSSTNAQNVLSEIKSHMTINERFTYLYGNWAEGSPRWKSDSIIVNRARELRKEGTIDAVGMDTKIVSRHYDWIFLSDVVDMQDRDSAAKRRDTRLFCSDVFDLVKDENTPIWIDGTYWHFDDYYHYVTEELNETLSKNGFQPFKVVIKPVHYRKKLGDPPELDGKLRYPQIFSESRINKLLIEKGIVQYSAQYELECLADKTQIFKRDAMHTFKMAGIIREKCRVIGYHDPALGESEKACFAPIITGYIADYDDAENNIKKGEILIVDMYVERLSPSEGKVVIAKLHDIHNYAIMGCERNGFQKVYADGLITIQLGNKTVRVPIYPILNDQSKSTRIESFEPYYTNGAVKFREDWRTAPNNYREGLSQLWNYPLDEYRDVPDALEGLIQTARQSNVSIA